MLDLELEIDDRFDTGQCRGLHALREQRSERIVAAARVAHRQYEHGRRRFAHPRTS